MSLDIEKEVVQIAGMVPPDIELARETVTISVESLEEVNRKYGPDSDNPLDGHNAPHSIGAMRRGVRLGTIFYPYIKPVHRRRLFDLTMVGEATHDEEQLLGPGENEAASTVSAVARIEAADGVLNTDVFKGRIALGHGATVIEVQEDGSLVQVNLLKGSRDPIKIIGAYGDIGGIGMEGSKTMLADATNFYYENCRKTGEKPTFRGLLSFIGTGEIKFMRDQFNKRQVGAALAFYFGHDAKPIHQELRKQFQGNIDSSFQLATTIAEHPELEGPIGRLVSTVDRSHVGPMALKLIHSITARG
jgi:hypothetical protein